MNCGLAPTMVMISTVFPVLFYVPGPWTRLVWFERKRAVGGASVLCTDGFMGNHRAQRVLTKVNSSLLSLACHMHSKPSWRSVATASRVALAPNSFQR